MLLELAVFAGLPWCDLLKRKPTVHVVPVAYRSVKDGFLINTSSMNCQHFAVSKRPMSITLLIYSVS